MPKRRAQRSSSQRRSSRGPVKRADPAPFVAEVRDLASDGRAVVIAPSGRVTFVPGAWPGEQIKVVTRDERGRVAEGELLEVVEPHPQRRLSPCKHHGYTGSACGGCPWQFMDYPSQIRAKKQRVEQALIALLGAECAVPAVEELAAPNEWHYRNRAQFKSDGERLGYLAARSRSIVDITECPVLTASNQSQLARLRNKLPNPEWRPSRSREWTTLDIDDQRSDAIINQRQPFRQGNTEQNTVMKDWLRSQLGTDTRPLKVLELFAGSGNFTQVLVDPERTVVAVEVAETALQAMSEAGLPNVVVECCDLFDNTAAEALATRHADTRWLVLDPPRDGFTTRESVIPRLIELERVLYISCDLATWQRDARYFLDEGFSVDEVSLIDLFPQTPHVEILSTFSRL